MKPVTIVLGVVVSAGAADTRLIYLNTEAGRELISESQYKEDFWALSTTWPERRGGRITLNVAHCFPSRMKRRVKIPIRNA